MHKYLFKDKRHSKANFFETQDSSLGEKTIGDEEESVRFKLLDQLESNNKSR